MTKKTDKELIADFLDRSAGLLAVQTENTGVAFTDAMRTVLGYRPGVSFTRMDADHRTFMVRSIMSCISQFKDTTEWVSWLFSATKDDKVEFLRATAARLRETETEKS